MRRRLPVAAASVALAISVLTACNTHVGTAATVDGHRISESEVSKYLTPNARSVVVSDQNGGSITVPARVFILNTIIDDRLFPAIAAKTHEGLPAKSDVDAARTHALAGTTPKALAEQNNVIGFSPAFDELWLRVQILGNGLGNLAQNGEDLTPIISGLHFPVTVNPRYGTWNGQVLSLSADPHAGLPSFLRANATYTPPVPSPSPSNAASPVH